MGTEPVLHYTHTKLSAVNHVHHFKDDYVTVIHLRQIMFAGNFLNSDTSHRDMSRVDYKYMKTSSPPSDVPQVPNKLSELKLKLFVNIFTDTNVFH